MHEESQKDFYELCNPLYLYTRLSPLESILHCLKLPFHFGQLLHIHAIME